MFPATRFTRAMIRPAATAQQLRWCLAARPRGVSSSNDNAATKGTKKPRSKLALYADLTKARLSSLVVVTSGAGFLAGGAPVDVAVMAATCVGTGLCAASAGAFNQILETSRDAAMNRTKQRPLPSGLVTPTEATAVGVAAGAAGTALLYTMANPTVAALGALNIALYAGPYTLSKRHTEWNTWIGSVVGAVPPVMGYAAASGGVVFAAEPAALASLLFLWQFPHFFALSWMHREDYARGGTSFCHLVHALLHLSIPPHTWSLSFQVFRWWL